MDENTLTPGAYTLPNDCKAFVRKSNTINGTHHRVQNATESESRLQ